MHIADGDIETFSKYKASLYKSPCKTEKEDDTEDECPPEPKMPVEKLPTKKLSTSTNGQECDLGELLAGTAIWLLPEIVIVGGLIAVVMTTGSSGVPLYITAMEKAIWVFAPIWVMGSGLIADSGCLSA
jgi:hypothetical protein